MGKCQAAEDRFAVASLQRSASYCSIMTFSEHLIAQRQLLNLTQAKAAELLGISKSALEKWEAGVKTPKPLTQEGAIARFEKAHREGLH